MRLLEHNTKQRVTAVHTEAEEVMTQAAAQLLHALQQQQKAAAEAAAAAQWDGLQEPTLGDIHQHQHPDAPQLQLHQQVPADQSQPPQQLQVMHDPNEVQEQHRHEHIWVQELEQHRHSWQQLEQEEMLLQEQELRSVSRPSSSRAVNGHPATAANDAAGQHAVGYGGGQWKQPESATSARHPPAPVGHAMVSSISAPASLSASRRSSRTRSSGADADARWQDNSQPQSRSRMLQPPSQLLRALSATEVLRRASSGRQQLQQGLLEGLRRASEASSGGRSSDIDSSRDNKAWTQLIKPEEPMRLRTISSRRSGTWQEVLAGQRPMSAAETQRTGHSRRAADASKIEMQQQVLRQTCRSEVGTPWRLSSSDSRQPASTSGKSLQMTVSPGHKPTKALDLLDTDSD